MKIVTALMILIGIGITPTAWALEGLRVGMRAPGFSGHDLQGKALRFADLKESKLIVITFFATWSETAAELLERLEKLFRQYENRGLTVVGVNVESLRISPSEETAVRRLVQDLRLSFPVLLDRGLETFRGYGVVAVPSTVVIDKAGTIVGELAGYPLALRESLFDLIIAKMTGKQRTQKIKTGYQPKLKAIRYYNLGRALVARGSVGMAEVNLKRSIESDARFVLPLLLLGQLFKAKALIDENIEVHGQTFTTAFFSPEERQRLLAEAESLFRKALEVDPGNATALTELGVLLARQGQEAEAEKLLRQALKTNPSHTPAHCFLGEILLERDQVQEAQKAFKAATRLNPLDHKCYLVFARTYAAKGMLKQAVHLYKESLELLWESQNELFPISFTR